MKALVILFVLAMHATLSEASESKQLLGVLGVIRMGVDEEKSLVLFQLRSNQKTVLIPVAQRIGDTPYRLLRVTRQGAFIQGEGGQEEFLELEQGSAGQEYPDQATAPVAGPLESTSPATAEVETPRQQEIVWPKTTETKNSPKVEVRAIQSEGELSWSE